MRYNSKKITNFVSSKNTNDYERTEYITND